MKITSLDNNMITVEMHESEMELISSMFAMIGAMEEPNWWATEVGLPRPLLDEEKFRILRRAWSTMTIPEASPSTKDN